MRRHIKNAVFINSVHTPDHRARHSILGWLTGDGGKRENDYAANNVAKKVIEFPVTIPRKRLRPEYGDGFGGAPLDTFPPKPDLRRNRGASTDGAGVEGTTPVEGEAHV